MPLPHMSLHVWCLVKHQRPWQAFPPASWTSPASPTPPAFLPRLLPARHGDSCPDPDGQQNAPNNDCTTQGATRARAQRPAAFQLCGPGYTSDPLNLCFSIFQAEIRTPSYLAPLQRQRLCTAQQAVKERSCIFQCFSSPQ